MSLLIREERPTDGRKINELVKLSFKKNDTAYLVNILRSRKDFIKDLSIVGELENTIASYVLLSPVYIDTEGYLVRTLWLEPLCVHPNYQRKGIGTTVIKSALEKGIQLGFESVFVTGDSRFYSRFGFKRADAFGIYSSLDLPLEAFLALELKNNGLNHKGKLLYPNEMFE